MSAGACKAALCWDQCKYGIVHPRVREFVDGIANLAANNQFTEDQQDAFIKKAISFEKVVQHRVKEDLELEAQLKKIAGLDT